MGHEDVSAGIGMRDVRASFLAIGEDTPVEARIVVYLVRPERGAPLVWLKAQACDGEGRPLSAVPGHGLGWPNNQFRTVTQMMHFLLEQLYDQVQYIVEEAAEQRGERP